jgi:hypothetical protein
MTENHKNNNLKKQRRKTAVKKLKGAASKP